MRTVQLRRYSGALLAAIFMLLAAAGCGQSQSTPTPAPAPAAAATDQASSDAAASVIQAYRSFGGQINPLDASSPVQTEKVSNLVGTIAAFALTGGNPPCAGFVQQVPSLVFTLGAGAKELQVAFDGDVPTTVIVVAEGEAIVCDEKAPVTMKPSLTLPKPAAGRYGVWIGRQDMRQPVNGTITATFVP